MPISGGTAGAHDDAMHQGSAKRDVDGGVAGLDALGDVLATHSAIELERNPSEDIEVIERTSGGWVLRLHRDGANDYTGYIISSGVASAILLADIKDVINGIAALDAGGAVLAPGSEVKLTRDGSENIEVVERTSGDIVYRWTRIGANDYECRINCGGVACKMLNDSLINAANGIAGLDASSRVLQANSFLPVPDISNANAYDTVYQAGARPRLVIISFKSHCGATPGYALLHIQSGSSTPPTTIRYSAGIQQGAANEQAYHTMMAVIPASHYYRAQKAEVAGGTITAVGWHELDL